MRKFVAIYLALFAALFVSWQCLATSVTTTGAGVAVSAPSYQGPADIVSAPVFCVSMFACSNLIATTGTQKLVRLVNTGSSEQCDFLPASTGKLGVTAAGCTGSTPAGTSAATFCSGGCTVTTFYNQVGVGNLTRTTAMPNFALSQIGGNPAIVGTTLTGGMDGNTSIGNAASIRYSTSTVFQRTGGAGGQTIWEAQLGGTALLFASSTSVLAYQSSVTLSTTSNDNLPHASQVVCAANTTACDSSTTVYVDGVSAVSGSTTRGLSGSEQPCLLEPNNTATNQCQCAIGEFVIWAQDNTTSVGAINTNAHAPNRWNF